jgi:hypothetical protein
MCYELFDYGFYVLEILILPRLRGKHCLMGGHFYLASNPYLHSRDPGNFPTPRFLFILSVFWSSTGNL